jgi:hypothetical protein
VKPHRVRLALVLAGTSLFLRTPESARADALPANQQLARDIYKELVEINTVTATGDTAKAAEAMAARLISVTRTAAPFEAPASVLDEEIMGAIEKLSNEFWPGVPVIPTMSTGGTSGTHLRNAGIPTYGHSGLAADLNDSRRALGRDERVLVKSLPRLACSTLKQTPLPLISKDDPCLCLQAMP